MTLEIIVFYIMAILCVGVHHRKFDAHAHFQVGIHGDNHPGNQ